MDTHHAKNLLTFMFSASEILYSASACVEPQRIINLLGEGNIVLTQ